jgi:hypothetical protein
MRDSRWSLIAVLTSLLGCSAPSERATSDLGEDEQEATDPPPPARVDAGKQTTTPPPTQGERKDAGSAPPDKSNDEPANCGESAFLTKSVMPDMLIVLDRSGSMRADIDPKLRCDNLTFLDFERSLNCQRSNIDCSRAADKMLIYCGGTDTKGSVDRWTPSVAAVRTLTTSFDDDVRFGLMTFPAANNECGPGELRVPVGLGTASMIGTVLGNTRPGGGTPTGESLRSALTSFQSMKVGPDSVAGRKYVLLVTDGQPTCPNSDGGSNDPMTLAADKQHTIQAIDALREAGIRTFVVGYDAQIDPSLATALGEFAQHGDTERYYPVQNEESLVEAFNEISQTVISCDFTFAEKVEDPAYLHVTLDGADLRPDPAEGWTIAGNVVTVHGAACATLQEGRAHTIKIVKACKPVIYF